MVYPALRIAVFMLRTTCALLAVLGNWYSIRRNSPSTSCFFPLSKVKVNLSSAISLQDVSTLPGKRPTSGESLQPSASCATPVGIRHAIAKHKEKNRLVFMVSVDRPTHGLYPVLPNKTRSLSSLRWPQQPARQLRKVHQPLHQWDRSPHRLAMKHQATRHQNRMRNGGATARANVHIAAS